MMSVWAIAALSGCLVAGVAVVLWRADGAGRPAGERRDPARSRTGQDDDRRIRVRRVGSSAPIHITFADGSPPRRGVALDRSSGGMRLAVEQALPVGTLVGLTPANAPPGAATVRASVRWCKKVDLHFEFGCRFCDDVPLAVLMQFG
jgi:hypothetical protein